MKQRSHSSAHTVSLRKCFHTLGKLIFIQECISSKGAVSDTWFAAVPFPTVLNLIACEKRSSAPSGGTMQHRSHAPITVHLLFLGPPHYTPFMSRESPNQTDSRLIPSKAIQALPLLDTSLHPMGSEG